MNERRPPESRRRTEPSIGDLDQLPGAASTSRTAAAPSAPSAAPPAEGSVPGEKRTRTTPAPRRGLRRWWWLLLALLAIVLAALAWTHQDALRSLLPRTQLNTLLERADQALDAGRLEGRDGNSARELYEAVRALEPDNEQAIEGLRKVGDAELERARQAIAQHDYDAAQNALSDARSLLGGGDAVNALSQQLVKARQSQAQTGILITQARTAFAQGQLDGASGAAALYRQALEADPDNAVARHGLDQVGNALAAQARSRAGQRQPRPGR